MLCPANILVDDVAGNPPLTVTRRNLTAKSFVGQQSATLRKAKRPAWRHDGPAGELGVTTDLLLQRWSVNEVIHHFPTGG